MRRKRPSVRVCTHDKVRANYDWRRPVLEIEQDRPMTVDDFLAVAKTCRRKFQIGRVIDMLPGSIHGKPRYADCAAAMERHRDFKMTSRGWWEYVGKR